MICSFHMHPKTTQKKTAPNLRRFFFETQLTYYFTITLWVWVACSDFTTNRYMP